MRHSFSQDRQAIQTTPPMRGETRRIVSTNTRALGFQSTPPMRGATSFFYHFVKRRSYFNPRPPCGERPDLFICQLWIYNFNPRPPCGERLDLLSSSRITHFISIHAPHAGSDFIDGTISGSKIISIHAPHAGSDLLTIINYEGR